MRCVLSWLTSFPVGENWVDVAGIAKAANGLFEGLNLTPEQVFLEHPGSEDHGDYSTNVALQLAKTIGARGEGLAASRFSSREMAEKIVGVFKQSVSESASKDVKKEGEPHSAKASLGALFERFEVAGPGFINFWLTKEFLVGEVGEIHEKNEGYGGNEEYGGKRIMVEFAHPNTHKEMHIGHMRTLITGEALSRILQASGAKIFRANYQGDIGPHVAKAIWGTKLVLAERKMNFDQAEKLSLKEKAHLLGQGYVRGNQEYETHKEEIDQLNSKIYHKDPEIVPVYERTRKWSLDYYKAFYERFYTEFDRLYFESEVAEPGKRIVKENIGRVFRESDGAIIFDGEEFGLHKRVFVTKDGNPTYEGKEMALGPLQFSDFPFDLNVHVVASEQAGYFQVVIKALEQLDPKFVGREFHLSMGMVQLVGKKMSSRTGVFITVDGLIDDVKELLRPKLHSEGFSEEESERVLEAATVGAVKYSVLKTSPLLNAVFDLEKSVSLEGDSGPYLQYTYARARSVLRMAQGQGIINATITIRSDSNCFVNLTKEEVAVMRYLYRFPEVVEQAARTYSPNLICSYLFELAKRFNNFYNNVPILQGSREDQGNQGARELRLAMTEATAIVIKNGLNLLGIAALERM